MADSRLTKFVVAHPILAYFCSVAAYALLFLVVALTSHSTQGWPIFVVFGALLPIALIVKERRRADESGE
jgi:hypothetical protein